jgi:TP901 family phage tail tape measure protein
MATTMGNTIKWGISSSIMNNFTGSVQKAYGYVKNLDSSLNDIRIVSGQSAEQMATFAEQANKAAAALGASTVDYTSASLIYYQQGLQGEEVQERTDATIKMANVLGETTSEVSSYMTAIWNNFDDGSESLEHYGDVIAALGANTASSADEIAEGLSKFASVADTVGLSYDYATTALATVVAETRQSADIVGTAFKTLFARIQDLELGDTLDDGTTLGTYSQALEKVGISIKDQNGELKDMDDILDEMGAKWKTLSNDTQVALAQTVAGTRQYTQLVALMDNWDTFNENLEVTADANGTLEEQQETYMESTEAHLQQLSTAAEGVYDSLLDSKTINGVADIFTKLLNGTETFIDAIGGGKSALLGLGVIALKVFNKQIAEGLTRTIVNFQKAKENAKNLENVLKTIKDFKMSSAMADPVIKKVVEAKDKLKDYYEYMSQEEINLSNDMIKTIEEIAEEADSWNKVADAHNSYVKQVVEANRKTYGTKKSEEFQTSYDIRKDTNQKNKNIAKEELEKANTKTSETLKIYESLEQIQDRILITEDKIANNSKNRNKLQNELNNDKNKELDITEKLVKDVEKNKKFYSVMGIDVEELVNKYKDYDELLKSDSSTEKEKNKAYKELQENLSSIVNQVTNLQGKNEEALEDLKNLPGIFSKIEQGSERANEAVENLVKLKDIKLISSGIVEVVQGLGNIGFILSNLSSISDIFNDENLTSMEKFTQIFINLSMVSGSTFSLIKSGKKGLDTLSEVIDKVRKSTEGMNASEIIYNGLKKLNNKLIEKNVKLGGEEVIVEKLQQKEEEKNTGKLILENIQLAVKNALLGDTSKLVIAGIGLAITMAAAIAVTVSAHEAEAKALEKKKEVAEEANEAYNDMLDSYDDLKSSIESYQSAESALSSLTKGTLEWKEAVLELNKEVLNLLNTYPELADSIYNNNGILTISQEGIDTLLEEQMKTVKEAQNASLNASNSYLEEQNKSLINNWKKENYQEQNIAAYEKKEKGIKTEEIEEAANLVFNDSSLLQSPDKLVEALKDAGIRAEKAFGLSNLGDELLELGEELNTNTEAIKAQSIAMIQNDLENNSEYNSLGEGLQSLTTSIIEQNKENIREDKNYSEDKSGIQNLQKAIYGEDYKNTYLSGFNSEEDAKVVLEALGKDLSNIEIKNTGGNTFQYAERDENGELGEYKDIDYADYTEEVYEYYVEMLATTNEAVKEAISNAKTELEDFTNEYAGDIENSQDIIETAMAGGDLSEYDEKDIEAVLEDVKDKQDEYVASLEDAGVSSEDAKGYFSTLINTLGEVGNAALQTAEDFETLASSYKTNIDIINDLSNGSTISADDYDKLDDAYKGFFAEMLDGTYKLQGSAQDLKELAKSIEISDFKENQAIISAKNEKLEELQENKNKYTDLFNDSSNTIKATDSNKSFTKVADNDEFVYSENKVQRELELWEGFATTQEDLDKIEKYNENIKELNKTELDEIQNAVADLTDGFDNLDDAIESKQDYLYQIDLAIAESYDNIKDLKEAYENKEFGDAAFTAAYEQFDLENDLEGLDTDELKEYADYLQEAAENMDGFNDAMTDDESEIVAKGIMKMNNAIETLQSNYADWADVLKNSSKSSEEYSEALTGMRGAVADLLDTSDEFVSEDFINSHLDEISAAATGDGEAIDNLKSKLADDIIAQIIVNNGLESDKAEILDAYNSIKNDLPDIEVGASLDNGEFIDSLNDLIQQTGMSVDEVNALCDSLGYEAQFEEEDEPITTEVPKYTTTTHINGSIGDIIKGKDITITSDTEQTGTTPVTSSVGAYAMAVSSDGSAVPKIKKVTKKASGSANNASSSNAGGNSSGSSSSSNKDFTNKEYTSDIYHQINEELEELSNNYDKVAKAQDKLTGNNLAKNLKEQNDLLDKQIEKYSTKLGMEQAELEQLKETLSADGATFDDNGNLNYNDYLLQTTNNYNKELKDLTDQYNSDMNSLTKQSNQGLITSEQYNNSKENLDKTYEAAKKTLDDTYDEAKENADRYDELMTSEIADTESKIQEMLDSIIENNIEIFNMKIELELDLSDAKRTYNDWYNSIVKDFDDDSPLGKAQLALSNAQTYYNNSGTGTITSLVDKVNELNEINKKFQSDSNYTDDVYGDDAASAMEDLQKYQEELMSEMKEFKSQVEDAYSAYLSSIDDVNEALQDQIDLYNNINDSIDHAISLTKLIYKETKRSSLDSYYSKKVDNDQTTLKQLKANVDYWQKMLDSAEPNSDEYEKYLSNYTSALSSLQSQAETTVQDIIDKYDNAFSELVENFTESLAGMSLDDLTDEWDILTKKADMYLDDINASYEVSKLEAKYAKAISDSSDVKIQNKLTSAMEQQVAALKEKDKLSQYDVDLANQKYEVLLKQIALEEAQNNKTNMRLKRDSQGNYSYVYTQDDDAVADAQSELDDAKNDLWNLSKNNYTDLLKNFQSDYSDYISKLNDINSNSALDEDSRDSAIASLNEQYAEIFDDYGEQLETNRQDLLDIAKDIQGLDGLTDEELNAEMSNLIPQWNSATVTLANNLINGNGTGTGSLSSLNTLANEIKTNNASEYSEIQKALNNAGTSLESLESGTAYDGYTEKLTDLNTNAEEAVSDAKTTATYTKNTYNKLKSLYDTYISKDGPASKAITAIEKSETTIQNQLKTLDDTLKTLKPTNYNTILKEIKNEIKNSKTSTDTTKTKSTDQTTNNTSNNSSNDGTLGGVTPSGSSTTESYHIVYYVGKDRKEFSNTKYKDEASAQNYVTSALNWSDSYYAKLIRQAISKNNQTTAAMQLTGISAQYWNNSSSDKNIRKTFPLSIEKYDTGGYTGDWDSKDGKLAMLHEKELVLNKADTENILEAVKLSRANESSNLMSALNNIISLQEKSLASISSNSSEPIVVDGQKVQIEATFPNVKDASEIENALNNLTNKATQYIYRTN